MDKSSLIIWLLSVITIFLGVGATGILLMTGSILFGSEPVLKAMRRLLNAILKVIALAVIGGILYLLNEKFGQNFPILLINLLFAGLGLRHVLDYVRGRTEKSPGHYADCLLWGIVYSLIGLGLFSSWYLIGMGIASLGLGATRFHEGWQTRKERQSPQLATEGLDDINTGLESTRHK